MGPMGQTERRRHVRLELGFPVRLHVPGQRKPIPAQLKDISMGGCFFWAAPLADTDHITVSVSFRRQPPVIFGAGPIIRRAGDRGFGVRFDDASQDGARFIDALSAVALDLRPDFAKQFLDREVQIARA
jgi:PilZ domain